jgi:hypothetical protein
MEENKPSLDNWAGFAGEYLKCEVVTDWPFKCVVKDIGSEFRDGKPKFYIVTEYKGRTFKLNMNKTNLSIIQNSSYLPKQLIGKIFHFEKIKVRNPTTNQMVDSFVLMKIE